VSFLKPDELKQVYTESKREAHIWREDYPAFERLMENGLMDGMDDNLPEVNDGSLAASLFKLPKRIVSSKLSGTVKTLDSKEAWVAELAQLQWKNDIIPNANSQAPFHRKWKDAVRKAAGYGSVPLITLFLERNGKRITDFIVAQPQDVTLEPGKVSDYDSDVLFWDVYFSELQLRNMIEQAKADKSGDNEWNVKALQDILDGKEKEERSSLDSPKQANDLGVRPSGFKFYIAAQRGVNAPFVMRHAGKNLTVRQWNNPDPTGDVPIHFLYCYQDFVNPYGIGIVKLAGGTQNVLDYMRQADVLATQLGLRPPIAIEGQQEMVDEDSLVYAQDAIWYTGGQKVVRQELANGVYEQLPNRMAMYKTSLNQLIPTGDTSIATGAGDPQYSKTPQGVQFQADNLSIDDEDFRDNLYVTYAAVAKSMINTHFANMEGKDLVNLSDDERDILVKAGIEFPTGPDGKATNQLEIVWDTVRAKFDFEVDPSSGVKTNDMQQVQNIKDALTTLTPQANWYLGQDGWKLNMGELYHSLFTKMNLENVDKLLDKMTDEEAAEAKKQPFPIIDPPSIRLTGQIPTKDMSAALAQGGVQTPPDNGEAIQEQVDVGDILKDPNTTPMEKAQIKAMAGIQPDPSGLLPATTDTGAAGPTPDEVALKQRELDIKQQGVDQKSSEIALAAQQQAHTQKMDVIREANQPNPLEMEKAKAKLKQPDAKPKAKA
jgi:hypothetical protein